ncbi:hypothetical protein HT102_07085 [Hoyosella sp. G463]|uniref:DUF6542 domain-containing protein n=1 Tax=Lolliginicoccus lacisalsi TaxID=2742202 RepID=A0A927JBH0_9ACTN|nr:DUF6542 domain-containing protein [Lolliginicoccus lacisalsi]MBD8506243.1 hypothetical protein [Lolliginicoccus lacisalsi]
MPDNRQFSSPVPAEMRSLLPHRSGVPWWGAIAIAVGLTIVGVVLDAIRGDELTLVFSAFYFLGCTAAVILVQQRALFTAMAQPPLILFAAVPLAYQVIVPESSGGLRTRIFDLVIPLVSRFPLMLLVAAVVVVIGGIRLFLPRSTPQQPRRVQRPGRASQRPGSSGPGASRAGYPQAGSAQAGAPRAGTSRQHGGRAGNYPGGTYGQATPRSPQHEPRSDRPGITGHGPSDPRG